MLEKREHSRVKVAWPVFAETNRKLLSGEAINISPGGVFILTQEPLKLGEIFELTVSVPFRDSPVMAIVEAVRSQTIRSAVNFMFRGMGIQFIVLSDGDRESMSVFVSDKLKSNVISFKHTSSRNLL
jgi:hypothetical protein